MKQLKLTAAAFAMIAAVVLGMADTAAAQRRDDRDIRDAIRSLNSKLEDFQMSLRYQMQSSSANSAHLSDGLDRIRGLRDSIRRFQDNYDRRRENRDDVNEVVTAAQRIEQFLQMYPQNRRVTDDWQAARAQIDRLAGNYGVRPDWHVGDDPPQWVQDDPDPNDNRPVTSGSFSVGLSGTYDLDRGQSENIDDVLADTRASGAQREELKDKLTAPEQIAIDIRGSQVTLATSNASPVTFAADGREKTERDAQGRTIRLRATLTGDKLVISSLGGETDYTITFTSVSDGRTLKVSRRITTEYLRQTVFAESVYNKTDSVARLGIPTGGTTDPDGGYSDNDDQRGVYTGTGTTRGGAPRVTTRPGNYVVPNGVVLTGVLENEINTKISQNNDRFRLTVQSPNEFRGAVIEGYITGVKNSGRVTGRSNIEFNFERITLRNGQRYDFAGNLQNITNQDGKTVKIDNEGAAQGDSQTKETAKRGGIGAGLGAIIGAIAGGAKGAAIGAVIGGGAGAGSVIVTGKDDLRLLPGSTMTVSSSSPANIGPR